MQTISDIWFSWHIKQTYHNSLIVIHLRQRFTIGEYLINSGGPRPNISCRWQFIQIVVAFHRYPMNTKNPYQMINWPPQTYYKTYSDGW